MAPPSWKEIEKIFHPRGIAVFGVSRKGGLGTLLLQGFLDQEFPKLFPINPKAAANNEKIHGLEAYPDLNSVKEPVDLAVLSVHPDLTKEIIIQCGENNVSTVILFTAGFAEKDPIGREKEQDLVQIARKYGMRLIGPNCMGLYCPSTRLSFFPGLPRESGPVGFITQSGSIGSIACFASSMRGINFSKVISFGNGADLDFNDFFEYLGEDPDTKVIVCYLEGVRDGQRFISLARKIVKKKPVIIWKVGETGAGAKAASSHTGSIVGNYSLWTTIFNEFGVILVKNMPEMIETIGAFINPHYPEGNRVAVISGPGGPAVSSADACEKQGLHLARITERTVEELESLIPQFGTSAGKSGGPIDIGLSVSLNPELECKILNLLGRDSNVDMLLIYLSILRTSHIRCLLKLQSFIQKPIAIVNAIDIAISRKLTGSVSDLFGAIPAKRVPIVLKNMNSKGIFVVGTEQSGAKLLHQIFLRKKKFTN